MTPVEAWAIMAPDGSIDIQSVQPMKALAWLSPSIDTGKTRDQLIESGYRCVRVRIEGVAE